jgi:hypothetical protein
MQETQVSFSSGYQADSENLPRISRSTVLLQRDQESTLKPATGKTPKTHHKGQESAPVRRRKCRRPLHKSNVPVCKPVDCSWIQRIYSSTPYSASAVEKIIATADYVPSLIDPADTKEETRRQSTLRHDRHMNEGLYCPLVACLGPGPDGIAPTTRDIFDGSFSPSDDANSCESDAEEAERQEREVSALTNVVSTLLRESHEEQARYRSYSHQCIPK